jgi:hypothetical protein
LGNFFFCLLILISFLVPNSSIPTDSSSKLAYSHSTMEDILQCPLCLDRYHDPRALPCQHVFCCSCLKTIISSNILCSMITCPLCRHIFPYNNTNQFPISYIHIQLLDLVPINYNIKGKCTKCKEIHSLNLCPCCEYPLCKKCYKNDRENMFINLESIVQACYDVFNRMQTAPSFEINDLLHNADLLLNNSQTAEFINILSVHYQLKSVYEQMNQLPITIAKRPHENDDENSSIIKQMRTEQTSCLNIPEQIDVVDDDDDDIIFIETIQSKSATTPIEINETNE